MSQSSTVLTSKGFDRSSHMKSGFWLVAIERPCGAQTRCFVLFC